MNLAARAAVLKYLVIFVNENDDFSLLREKDKSGRDAISWIEELVEEDFDTYEEIMDFLYDHDPGIDSDDEESRKKINNKKKKKIKVQSSSGHLTSSKALKQNKNVTEAAKNLGNSSDSDGDFY